MSSTHKKFKLSHLYVINLPKESESTEKSLTQFQSVSPAKNAKLTQSRDRIVKKKTLSNFGHRKKETETKRDCVANYNKHIYGRV